jgi:hypothetical protein
MIELLGKFDAGQEVGCFRGIEVRMDRDEHNIRIALGKFNVAGRDLDHIRSVTILARLRRRTQIAPTNFDLCHARLISDYARQCYGGSSTPIFLRFPARRRALGILHLEPVRRSSRDIARVLALRHDAIKAELPCVLEHGCAIAVAPIDPFVQHQPRLHVSNQPVEIDLALLKWLVPQVLPAKLDQIEGA